MEKFAFFDVDNTIYNGYTASGLLTFMVERNLASQKYQIAYDKIINLYKKGEITYSDAVVKIFDLYTKALTGRTVDEVRVLTKELFLCKSDMFFEWVDPVFEYLRDNDYKIVILSAGPDVAINEIAKILKVSDVFSTKLAEKNGIYSGNKPLVLNDEVKVEKIREILEGVEGEISIGFGDSSGDVPMLELMNYAFVRESDHHPDMMKLAKEKKWTIFSTADKVISELSKIN